MLMMMMMMMCSEVPCDDDRSAGERESIASCEREAKNDVCELFFMFVRVHEILKILRVEWSSPTTLLLAVCVRARVFRIQGRKTMLAVAASCHSPSQSYVHTQRKP